MSNEKEKSYSLEVAITKTCQETGKVEHSAVVKSHNLSLEETVDMQKPLLEVLGNWVSEDAS